MSSFFSRRESTPSSEMEETEEGLLLPIRMFHPCCDSALSSRPSFSSSLSLTPALKSYMVLIMPESTSTSSLSPAARCSMSMSEGFSPLSIMMVDVAATAVMLTMSERIDQRIDVQTSLISTFMQEEPSWGAPNVRLPKKAWRWTHKIQITSQHPQTVANPLTHSSPYTCTSSSYRKLRCLSFGECTVSVIQKAHSPQNDF